MQKQVVFYDRVEAEVGRNLLFPVLFIYLSTTQYKDERFLARRGPAERVRDLFAKKPLKNKEIQPAIHVKSEGRDLN